MTGEHEQFAPAFDETSYAWDVFQYWTASDDEARFRESYLGHYASRAAFGEELLHQLGVDSRLQKLPAWLRVYIRFDGEAVVADFRTRRPFLHLRRAVRPRDLRLRHLPHRRDGLKGLQACNQRQIIGT